MPPRLLGTDGEALAAEHLEQLGYRILAKDCKLPPGQLDLVALDGQTLVFVEVKTRAGIGFGLPQESVGAHKIRKLQQLAQSYLQRWPHRGPVRFDVIGLVVKNGRVERLDHIRNAIS